MALKLSWAYTKQYCKNSAVRENSQKNDSFSLGTPVNNFLKYYSLLQGQEIFHSVNRDQLEGAKTRNLLLIWGFVWIEIDWNATNTKLGTVS